MEQTIVAKIHHFQQILRPKARNMVGTVDVNPRYNAASVNKALVQNIKIVSDTLIENKNIDGQQRRFVG